VTNSNYVELVRLIGRTKSPRTKARMTQIYNRLPKERRDSILRLSCDPIGALISRVLHRQAQEMITEEQLERVLAPIKRMIRAGLFDTAD